MAVGTLAYGVPAQSRETAARVSRAAKWLAAETHRTDGRCSVRRRAVVTGAAVEAGTRERAVHLVDRDPIAATASEHDEGADIRDCGASATDVHCPAVDLDRGCPVAAHCDGVAPRVHQKTARTPGP